MFKEHFYRTKIKLHQNQLISYLNQMYFSLCRNIWWAELNLGLDNLAIEDYLKKLI